MPFKQSSVRALARLSRRIHPPGTFHLVRMLHTWEKRSWALEEVVPFERNMRVWASTSNFVEWIVYFFGEYEPEVASVIRRSIRPGTAAIDVGSNVGYLSLVMAEASRNGPILSCEPNPMIFRRLLQNIELNEYPNIRPRQIAIADKAGTAKLYVPNAAQPNLSTSSLQQNPEFLQDAEALEVKVVTLNELVSQEDVPQIDLIKIDVEGYEGPVLVGGLDALGFHRPTLVFEYRRRYWEAAGHEFEDIETRLRNLGYERFLNITPQGPKAIPSPLPADMNVLVPGKAFS